MPTQFANQLTWHHQPDPHALDTMHEDTHAPTSQTESEDLGRQLLRQRMFPEQTQLSRIGRYTVLRFLAAGGMGQVFVAYDPDLDRRVALKLLSPGSTCMSEASVRLLREAQALAKLSHPNVVQIYEVGEASGQVYLAMEFVVGRTLREWLESEPETSEILDKFTQAGRGLAAAHAAGLIHRDFTPANVLVDDDGWARVLDFGLVAGTSRDEDRPRALAPTLASAAPGPDIQLTHTGALMGTPSYMSPEQLRGDALDARSDQFSFCVALHEALTGERPFAGRTIVQLTTNVLGGHRQDLPAFDKLPRRIREALERGLSVDPSARWPSMDELLDALAPPSRTKLWLMGAAAALPLLAFGTWQLVDHYERELDVSAEQLALSTRAGAAESLRAERATDEREAIALLRAAEEIELLAHRPGYELDAVKKAVELLGPDIEGAPAAAHRGLNLAMLGRVPLARVDSAERSLADAAFSPDGSHFVTTPLPASDDTIVELWSTQPPQLVHSLELAGRGPSIAAPQFSPDGSQVALSSWTRCTVFEVESGARVGELGNCNSPQWSIDSSTLYAEVPCSDQNEQGPPLATCALAAWDVESGKRRWTKQLLGRGGSFAVHPEGELLVLRHDYSANEVVELVRTSDGRREALLERAGRGRTDKRLAKDDQMALSADGNTLALVEHDEGGRVVTWNLVTREATVLETVMPTAWGWFFASMDISADGQSLLIHGRGGGLSVFDLERGAFAFAQPWGSSSAAPLPLGWLAISQGEWLDLPGPFRRQAATSAKQLRTSPDGRFALSISREGSRLWSLESQLVSSMGHLPSGERPLGLTDDMLVSYRRLGGVRVYPRNADGSIAAAHSIHDESHAHSQPMDVASDRPTRMVFRHQQRDAVYDLGQAKPLCELPSKGEDWELDPSGTHVVAVFGKQARVWEVDGCTEIERFSLPRRGMWIDSVARNGAVHLRAEQGFNYVRSGPNQAAEIDAGCEQEHPTYFRLSPDASVLVTNCDAQLSEYVPAKLWDARSGELLRELDLRGYSGNAQFTPDSSALLVRAGLQELAVVDIESGRERLRVPGRLSPDPNWVPRGDADALDYAGFGGELVRVPLSLPRLFDAACETLARAGDGSACD